MTFPLSITLYEPGSGGIPTITNPRNLAGWVEDYQDSICLGFGCEVMRVSGIARSREEAADWVARLMSAVEVYTPTGRLRFSGFLNEVVLPSFDAAVSLTNMANAILVRWGDPDGKQGTTTVSNAASIARYGRKERILNESISLEADATNRATMILAQIAEPLNKETVVPEKGEGEGFPVQLVFVGWAEALKWLTTTSTTETTQASTTQVTGLLTAYNAVNNFFDTAAASITATGHAATQFCPPDTTYLERIDKLLSFGDTTQRRIAWGFYSRAITIAVAATSAPDTITYNYSKRAGKLWTTEGNFIEPYDWVPDVMVQNVDVIGPAPASGAIASLTRKYIRRATLRIDKSGTPTGTLEPDDVDNLAEMVANPVSKNSGISQRHQIAEARIRDAMGSRTLRTDNGNLWNSSIGVLRPEAGGTGNNNTGNLIVPSDGTIDLGGGTIDTGGGDIVFDPGGGTGLTGGGSSPNLAKWSGPSSLTNAVSGTDYAPAHAHPYAATSHTHPASDVVSGILATARLGSGTANSTKYLAGDSTWQDFTPGAIGAIDGSGAATRVAYFSDTDTLTSDADFTFASDTLSVPNLFISGASGGITIRERDGAPDWALYATGGTFRFWDGAADVVTIDLNGKIVSDSDVITLGGFDLNLDGSLRVSGAGAASGEALIYDGTAFVPTALTVYAPADAKYIVQTAHAGLSAEQALGALATGLLKNTTTTGVLSIAVAGTDYATAGHTHSGTIDGSGAATRVATWSDADTLTSDANFTFASDYLSVPHLFISGAAGDITIRERDGSGDWIMYATASLFRFFNGSDLLTINTSGKIASDSATIDLGSFTLTAAKTGTVITGVGVTNRIPYFSDANTLSTNADFTFDGASMGIKYLNAGTASGAREGEVLTDGAWAGFAFTDRAGSTIWTWYANSGVGRLHDGTVDVLFVNAANNNLGVGATPNSAFGLDVTGSARFIGGTIRTNSGFDWNFSSYVAGAIASTGYVQVSINGTSYKLLAST